MIDEAAPGGPRVPDGTGAPDGPRVPGGTGVPGGSGVPGGTRTASDRPGSGGRSRAGRSASLRSIFSKSLADRLGLVLIVGIVLFGFGIWMGPLYASLAFDLDEMLAGLPDALLSLFGDMSTAAGFINAEIYSIAAPGMIVYVAVASSAKAFAGEEEDLTIGLLLAAPVSRTATAVQKLAAMAVHVSVVAALTGLGVWAGALIADLDVLPSNVLAASAHLALFGLVVGALAALVSVITGRRVISQVTAAVAALTAYVWASFAPLSTTLEPFTVLSPWHWYFGPSPLVNGADPGYLALLAGLAGLLGAGTIWLFNRRDLPG